MLLAKIGFNKAFPGLRRFVPGLGLILAGASFVLILGAFGFGVLAGPGSAKAPVGGTAETAPDQEAETGREIFAGLCAGCHTAGRDASGAGLGLEGLLKRTILPASGRPATEESIRLQLRRPYRSMPAFTGLSEPEIQALMAYLRRL
jgi:mono/diheme cytochrome c family protein